MAALTLTIAGVDRSSLLQYGSFHLVDTLAGPSRLNITLLDEAGSLSWQRGQHVTVDLGATRIFGGWVYGRRWRKAQGAALRYWDLECLDYSHLAMRRLIEGVYDATMYRGAELGSQLDFELGSSTSGITAAGAVRLIVADLLAADGITVDTTSAPDGAAMERFEFNRVRLADALDALAQFAGVSWWIDGNKKLWFHEGSANATTLDGDTNVIGEVEAEDSDDAYVNRQFVRGGEATEAGRVETFTAVGGDPTLVLSFSAAQVLEVQVNGLAQSIGVRGQSSTAQWLWAQGSNEIGRGTASAPSAGATIRVVYDAVYPVLLRKSDASDVSARATLEGTTGVWESVEEASDLQGLGRIQDRADELLDRDGAPSTRVRLTTDVDGYLAGQTATITLTSMGITGAGWLLETVEMRHLHAERFRYTITASNSAARGGARRALQRLASRTLGTPRRVNELYQEIS